MTGKPYADWSEKRKQTLKEYNQKNYSVLGCKLPRETADDFRNYCKAQGKTVSSVLSEYVKKCLASERSGKL